MPHIEARKMLDRVFRPVINTRNAYKLGMLAYDDEQIASGILMAASKAMENEE